MTNGAGGAGAWPSTGPTSPPGPPQAVPAAMPSPRMTPHPHPGTPAGLPPAFQRRQTDLDTYSTRTCPDSLWNTTCPRILPVASSTCRRKAFLLNSIIRKATSLMLLPVHPGCPILCLCLPVIPAATARAQRPRTCTHYPCPALNSLKQRELHLLSSLNPTSLRPVLPAGNAWLNTGASAFVPRQSKVVIKAADSKEVDLQELRKQQAQAGAPIALRSPAPSPRCNIVHMETEETKNQRLTDAREKERLKKEEKCKKKEEEVEEKERKERKEQERKKRQEVKEEEERQGGR
ncbi:hypothetical protein GLOTRDRAFT_123758 [Gloeophyllum trabeum ATCC 11539]|uniref:Uncharacterized protein n=1 Tax=Gloeophyllum trabeum (strain ATCC 11539 / FP-39264 / Madison 617) TaxID=670483 RepID=S7RYK5_GLOTA|nr:uncharacterized protein GLOTRDRAFT_123758 [Gloeophyllum trabeum ATCC 11539]EPQ60000.1 hypothetical protein GLOTRDRAFT_123758 [Gloeophyllum trabeum ATCC 11539]